MRIGSKREVAKVGDTGGKGSSPKTLAGLRRALRSWVAKAIDAAGLAIGVGLLVVVGLGGLILVFSVFGPWAIGILVSIGFLALLEGTK